MTTSWTYILHWHTHVSDNVPTKRVKRDTFVRLPPLPRADTPINLPNIPPKKHLLRRNEKPKKIQHIPSVAVAVPTHNRIGYVQLASKAFSGTFPSKDVWLFDDKSTEYTPKELMRWYETKHIFSPEKQLKADAMARHILEWFVDTDYDVLVLLDSDLIVAPNWLDSLHAGLRDSIGVLSLYRSGAPKHKSSSCGAVLCEQPSMGNAGTVWRRELAEKMLSEMSNREGGFDWGWSEWCEKNKVPMQALKASAVLHIGMHGSWSHETTAEKSVGFPMSMLSSDTRKQAEVFLKGAKPIVINNIAKESVHSNWQSYITSTEHSQTDIKTAAYDSRNIWAEPDTCKHASGTPERPSKLFEKWSVQICSKYPKACTIFRKAFVDTWDNGITWLKDGTVFLVTGDIPLMWLRDSSAQVTHYLALSEHSSIQRLIEGVLRRQMKWIELDVYGSAFRMFLDFDHAGKKRLTDWDFKCGRTIHVAQHDYEMDSLAYVVRLAYQYWKKTGRTCWMQNVQKTWHRIVDMWILEQDHSKSTYTYPTLDNGGKGTPVCKTGMSWAGMRPSDDKMKYHYNIPGQLFAAKALEYIEEMSALWSDDTLKQKASKLRLEMLDGVKKHGVVDGVLAYETDGCGHHLMADDANIPSLLSLPYLDIHRPEYEKTRVDILSSKNPWWSEGGIGSPHTNGRGHPWHLAMIMEGWDDKSTLERVLKTTYGDSLHESVTMSGGSTRKWFGWANALFSEWLMKSQKPSCSFMQWESDGDCFKNKKTGGVTCSLTKLGMDSSSITVSNGGESPTEVRGRAESSEFPSYGTRTWFVPTGSVLASMIEGVTTEPFTCEEMIHGHTYFVKRVEYANVWHTMLDWYAFWETSMRLGMPDRIIWLDGHARGHLDDTWSVLFGVKPMYISSFNKKKVCFSRATFVYGKWHDNARNSVYPIAHKTTDTGCQTQMASFVQHFLKAYGISSAEDKKETIVIRRPYDAHPRVGKRIQRTISNLQDVKNNWPEARVVDLASKTFGEQLELVVNTRVLRAVHGAALTFLIFVQGEVIEWMPTTHYGVTMFEALASWSPTTTFTRKAVKSDGRGGWVIPTIQRKSRLFQVFPMNHELLFLEFRLRTTCDATDMFVIHEAEFDFMFQPKKRYAFEKRHFFESLCPEKIVWTVQRTHGNDNGWAQDASARNSIIPELEKQVTMRPDDIICLFDADEVPTVKALVASRKGPYPIQMKLFPFKYGLFWRYGTGFTTIPSVERFGSITKLYDLRHGPHARTIEDAGWHFSWVGSSEYIIQKAKQSHAADGRVGDDAEKMKPSFVKKMVCDGHDWDRSTHWGTESKFIENNKWPDFFNAYPTLTEKKTRCQPHLTIIIPFRENPNDAFSQGSGREKNLRDWSKYMCSFLPDVGRTNVDVRIIEQSQWGPFNKGALFNVGYHLSKKTADYLVLHDVDHIPEKKSNDYSFRPDPTHMCVRTSQWGYVDMHQTSIGGALMLTTDFYKSVNGYSNKFLGWGGEDDNMYMRIGGHVLKKLSPDVGRYKALDHKRTHGLDETELFRSHPNADKTSGVSDVKWRTISSKETKCGSIKFTRTLVDFNTHKLAIIIPFRSTVDKLAQGGPDREQNLNDWLEYMSLWLKIPVDVFIIEQSDDGRPFNKGALFNIGYDLTKDSHDYMILHDVDSVPLDAENTYEWKDNPVVLMKHVSSLKHVWNAGGVLQMSHEEYKNINGYSNIFWGWGFEDTNMAIRITQRLKLEQKNWEYRQFDHQRVLGLHKKWNKQYAHNERQEKIVDDSGISDIKYAVQSQKNINTKNHLKANRIKVVLQYTKGLIDMNSQSQPLIQTSDLFNAIDYNAPGNKGPWKQGWDYDYDGRFKDGLKVHVVPHSHNDPGWIKTYHTYYSTQTRHIIDTVVAALTEDPRRTFIWAEISYFSLWWDDASPQQKEQAKKLVAEKRLDFVTGGWVMNDEASVTARATRWHLQEGREWLQNTFGITPQYSWAIDPFGHSAGQAQVLKELGYKGMLIQRVHYAVKKQLAQKQQLEFQWQTPAGEIFTHMMPFYSYDGPHTCGPDPSVCCQFDFARIGKGKTWTGCPWGKMAVEITDSNVAERSRTWLDQVYKKAMLYRGKHVLVPVGDDFRYQTMEEAHKQFTNYQKMFDWIKVNVPAVKVSFSTLTRYFDAAVQTQVPKLQGSFFPYSDREKDYWTGYFNSRIFYKGYDRLLESLIAAVERKCPSESIHSEKRALGLFQHHDGITGTAKSHVVQDYYQTMQKAVTTLKIKLKSCLDISPGQIVNPLSVDTPTMKADEIRPFREEMCIPEKINFENIKTDKYGRIIEIFATPVHESLVWRSNTPGPDVAGAYLMSVTPIEEVLEPRKFRTCKTDTYKAVETSFDMVERQIRVYNDGTVEFRYDIDISTRNNGELWAVYKPEWTAGHLCSDVHGLTWECHSERVDAPLQAKFWPMPSMAWLASESHSKRMTWAGAQPTGVGFHKGAIVLMLDRRGDQDDARGLGQGITDSRPVTMRFGVLVEAQGIREKASEEAQQLRNWMLNPEIELV